MEIKAKFRSYCATCHYTVWQNERVNYDGKSVTHLECFKALQDETPRILHPHYVNTLGRVDKDKLMETANRKGKRWSPKRQAKRNARQLVSRNLT